MTLLCKISMSRLASIVLVLSVKMAQRMLAYADDADAVREFAADCVAAMCRRLLDGGAEELHFYTLNLAKPTNAVLSRLA